MCENTVNGRGSGARYLPVLAVLAAGGAQFAIADESPGAWEAGTTVTPYGWLPSRRSWASRPTASIRAAA